MLFALDRKSFVQVLEDDTRHVPSINEHRAGGNTVMVRPPELKNDHRLTSIENLMTATEAIPSAIAVVIFLIGAANHLKVWTSASEGEVNEHDRKF